MKLLKLLRIVVFMTFSLVRKSELLQFPVWNFFTKQKVTLSEILLWNDLS